MSESPRKLISIVIPTYNEESNIDALFEALQPLRADLSSRYELELVFTDNHSTDGTFTQLRNRSQDDPQLRLFRFSRNFGYQRSILTGYIKARGAAVVQLDADLQDPPELIREFVRLWEQGYHVVYGVRRSRQESGVLNLSRKVFYRMLDWVSEDHLPHDSGDFRLLDRKVVDALKQLRDDRPYLRGAIAALGFEQIGVAYDRQRRQSGESKFDLIALAALALDGLLNHSVVPLRLATYVGLSLSIITALGTAGYLIAKPLLGQHWPAGFATLAVLILLSLSLNALFLGIIGEYLGRIYRQLKRGPLTVIEQQVDPWEES